MLPLTNITVMYHYATFLPISALFPIRVTQACHILNTQKEGIFRRKVKRK